MPELSVSLSSFSRNLLIGYDEKYSYFNYGTHTKFVSQLRSSIIKILIDNWVFIIERPPTLILNLGQKRHTKELGSSITMFCKF